MIQLSTERLILRDHTIADIDSHHRLLSDAAVMRYLPGIRSCSPDASWQHLLRAIDQIGDPERKRYSLRIEDKRRANVGEIGYTVRHFTPVGKIVDLGYFLYPCFWGHGYATEAAGALIRFAFEENDVFRIGCGCIKDNAASERVMLKCGMIREGDFLQCEWLDGKIRDRVSYRLLRSEWARRKRVTADHVLSEDKRT